MMKVEYGGKSSDCPFCGRPIGGSGKCGCGALIECKNLSAIARQEEYELSPEEAEEDARLEAKLFGRVAKVAPWKFGRIIFVFYECEGEYYLARAQAPSPLVGLIQRITSRGK